MESANLLTALRKIVNDLLNAEGIYPVLDYGWEDVDTPSSEFAGLAMWITDAPFEPDFNCWDRVAPPPEPSTRDQIFYKAGEDFVGTMDLARASIGLNRYSWELRKPEDLLDDEETFWEHRAAAALWLNIASDRIRDYFIMARFGIPTQEYKKLSKENRNYLRPFEAHHEGEGVSARKTAVELLPIAKELQRFRKTRNGIVHDVASRQGRNAVISLSSQREEATRRPFGPRSAKVMTDVKEVMDASKLLQQVRQQELRDAMQELRDWYLLLVKASSMVFEYEYWNRRRR